MASTETDYTMKGGTRHYAASGRNYGQMCDVSNAFNRSGRGINEDNYDRILNSEGEMLYLARREQDNTIFICTYRAPKNIKVERARYKMRTGKEPIEAYMCAWIDEPSVTKLVRQHELDIYMPVGAPYIAQDINDENKVFANYVIGDKVLPVQIEFMEKLIIGKSEQILSLTKSQQDEILTVMLHSYNTRGKVQRGDMLADLLKKYGVEPITVAKMAKRG